jgi:ATP-dependent helicase YprA (DUF1998 family)/rubrerythrin
VSALLPIQTAGQLREGIGEYLSTTFALSDNRTGNALARFISDEASGMFRGPYVRTRMPFAPAATGAGDVLEWTPENFTAYGHQAAAFERLSTRPDAETGEVRRPEPTLVVTGTGSGKTEAFLLPFLDHARRERAKGKRGIKALLLYPMNALATDQAERLASMISSDPALASVSAGIYTGDYAEGGRTKVSADGIITDRGTIRADPPDLLLTNYKMLDQLLLRSHDLELWQASAESLQYVVLDEFHTYDGAQGTDVALLLRRLGLALSELRSEPWVSEFPLGDITPVATSATLGDEGDTSAIRGFAETVFGRPFAEESVITESRMTVEEWAAAEPRVEPTGEPATVPDTIAELNTALGKADDPADAIYSTFCEHVLGMDSGASDVRIAVNVARGNPLVQKLYAQSSKAISLAELAERVIPTAFTANPGKATDYISLMVGALGYIRAEITARDSWKGRQIPSIEAHLWVRELSRIDRAVIGGSVDFFWYDDGTSPEAHVDDATEATFAPRTLPAIFCRHCGRSGWMTAYEPGTETPTFSPAKIRQLSLTDKSAMRALISADQEVQSARENDIPLADTRSSDTSTTALRWLDSGAESFGGPDTVDLDEVPPGTVAVLMHSGKDAKDNSHQQACPACGARDSIRFIGSAVATLLSVALSNMFGTEGLDADDKKALVFTDSVQDASHRAGFVQARAHSFSLRNGVATAIAGDSLTLDELAAGLRESAFDPVSRYHLLHPSLVERKNFRPYWDPAFGAKDRSKASRLVADRIAFDMCLEFGLRSGVGRTLSLTGTAVAHVDAGGADLAGIARQVWESVGGEGQIREGDPTDAEFGRWARSVLERIRSRGGIAHKWLDRYVEDDGNAYHLFKSDSKAKGVPGFPPGGAPAFPRVGPPLPDSKYLQGTDSVANSRSWYARWTASALGVTNDTGQKLVKVLLEKLAEEGVLSAVITKSGATTYQIGMERIFVEAEDDPGQLQCRVCRNVTPAPASVREELEGAPCQTIECSGTLEQAPIADNYYRRLYNSPDSRAVVSREHTGLLDTADRAVLEKQFKQSSTEPGAPNVLVATPTLEMGIDIGDLSSVYLSSLPKTVASYVQRVGRAGRLTGNSLVVALLRGRGQNLPTVQDPLSMINGSVQPPAAFLSAAEILRRQFLAYATTQLMHEGIEAERSSANDVFPDRPGSLIGELRAGLADDGVTWLDTFLATVDAEISDNAAEKMREWVSGTDTGSHSIDSTLALAAHRWQSEMEELWHRLRKLETEVIPELKERCASSVATEEDHDELRSAESSARVIRRRRQDNRDEHWIQAMERFGLLPSYQLLDDQVSLEAAIQWKDPESVTWDTEKKEYLRGASAALREFAPGNSFYVDRLQIKIDSVELGNNGEDVEQWRACAACSHVETVIAGDDTPGSCPECGDGTFADMSQLLDVVPLRKVSAEVKRDSATIDENNENRVSRIYTIATTMSHRAKDIASQWYVEGTGFGTTYLREAEIRWLNLGLGSGSHTEIGGDTYAAPKFRLCEYCGHEDTGGVGTNTRKDHRPWCRYADDTEEHNRTVALGRTLRTEAVLLRLPASVSTYDSMTLPSLIAAINLGFRNVLGGNPDHLAVSQINVAQSGSVIPALLLHDTVPGGTGYLAEFSEPGKVRELLETAWNAVRACPCRDEDRLACPRCLLPHAPAGAYDRTSREVAEGALFRVLGWHRDDDGQIHKTEWSTTNKPPIDNGESSLEVTFRKRLQSMLKDRNAVVSEAPDGQFTKLLIAIPGTQVSWQLSAQKLITDASVKSKPDFILERTDGGSRKFAIFTDGYAFHASPAHNRLEDDAKKRDALRNAGYIPWAVTQKDLDATLDLEWAFGIPQTADWYHRKPAIGIGGATGVSPELIAIAAGDPVTLLVQLMFDEPLKRGSDTWNKLANASIGTAMTKAMLTGNTDDSKRKSWYERTHTRIVFSGVPDRPSSISATLQIDTSEAAAADTETFREDWNWWLRLSNLLSLRTDSSDLHVEAAPVAAKGAVDIMYGADIAVDVVSATSPSSGVEERAETQIAPEWAETLEDYDVNDADEDLALEARSLQKLAEEGIPLPESLGEEHEGMMFLAEWTTARVAVVLSEPEDNVRHMTDKGWQIIDGTAPDYVERISHALNADT